MNNLHYANLGWRFLALFIDLIVLSLLFFPVTKLTKGVWIMSTTDHVWGIGWFVTDPLCLIFLGVIFLYFVMMEGLLGATVGKKLLGMKIIRTDGHKPGLSESLLRNILRIVDALPALNIIGMVLILLSPERARFGDRIAKTRVVFDKAANSLSNSS